MNAYVKSFIVTLLFFFFIKSEFCQVNNTKVTQEKRIRALDIGDSVPDVQLNRLVNYPRQKAKISDFKGKVIILDFWSIGCSACIKGFPEMEKLQKYFENQLQVLLVNYYDSYDQLVKIGFPNNTRYDVINNTELPFVFDSEKLKIMFPHEGEPYHVWINQEGKVIALTEAYNATLENVEKALRGENLKVSKRLPYRKFDTRKPLLLQSDTSILKKVKTYSLITQANGIISRYSSSIIDENSNEIVGFNLVNFPILDLFRSAYRLPLSAAIFLELVDVDKYIKPKDANRLDEWRNQNLFCYEIKFSLPDLPEITEKNKVWREHMKNDLENYFEILSAIEKRKVTCWVLKNRYNTKQIDLNLNMVGDSIFGDQDKNDNFTRNVSVSEFLLDLQLLVKDYGILIMNEADFKGEVDFNIKFIGDDLSELNEALEKYGVFFTIEDRKVEILVLRNGEK